MSVVWPHRPSSRHQTLALVVTMLAMQVLAQAPRHSGRPQKNSFLPQIMAIAGVISTGNVSVDSALQMAVSHHLQGWFESSTRRYADTVQIAPTNMDCFIGAALAYHFDLSGCDEAARSLRTFLRLLRQQGPIHRRQVRCQRAPTQHMSHNTFGQLRVFIDNGIFVDASSFRDLATHVVDEFFCHFDPAAVLEGDLVFVNTFLLCAYLRVLHPLIRQKYVLITHNSDYPAPVQSSVYNFSHILHDRKLIAWFTMNANIKHPKLIPIPQGFPVNTKTLSIDWNESLAFSAQKAMDFRLRPTALAGRKKWIYVNFASRNESKRLEILRWAEAPEVASLVTVISVKTQQREYLKDIREHRFVWCPPGNGLDTHRVYETLQQGTIPLVLYHEDVTREKLEALIPLLQPALDKLWTHQADSVLTAAYWQRYVTATATQKLQEDTRREAEGGGETEYYSEDVRASPFSLH